MPATRGTKRRRCGGASADSPAAAAAAAASATEILINPGHAEALLKGLERARCDDDLDNLPLRIKLQVQASSIVIKVSVEMAVALSRPLAKMLVGPMASLGKDNVLSLGLECGCNPVALLSVANYMYTGRLELTEHSTFDVLSATNFLELDGAKELCAAFLSEKLSPVNALGMANAAVRFGCAELLEAARCYVNSHFAKIAEQAEFLALPQPEPVCFPRSSEKALFSPRTPSAES